MALNLDARYATLQHIIDALDAYTTTTAAAALAAVEVDDTAYDATSWNNATTTAPSKNSCRDKFVLVDAADALKQVAANTAADARTACVAQTITNGVITSAPSQDAVYDALVLKLNSSQVSDTAYDATSWNGNSDAPTKNAVRDKIESLAVSSKVAQTVYDLDTAMHTTTAQIPCDFTKPQIGEGEELLSVSITPYNAASTLWVECIVTASNPTNARNNALAIFKDSGPDCLYAEMIGDAVGDYAFRFHIKFPVVAGSTSAQVFSARFGSDSNNTKTINGTGATAYLGDTFVSSLSVTEILP